jgi:hypothetical protein
MRRVAQVLGLLLTGAATAHAGIPVITTPEPMSLTLVATGVAVVGAAWYLRRKR